MTILLFIGLSFFTFARLERKTAANVANTVRAELLSDGATAIAMAFLQQDWTDHPTATSIDHAWRTYFNGAWAVARPWMWRSDISGNVIPLAYRGQGSIPGLPEVPATVTTDLSNVLYVPRWETAPTLDLNAYAANPANFPFVYTHAYGTAPLAGLSPTMPVNTEGRLLSELMFYPEQVDFWTDFDNDNDGLNDSIWIPLQIESTTGPDGVAFTADNLDNDLDGFIDESASWATDGVDNPGTDPDFYDDEDGTEIHSDEIARFIYRGADGNLYLTTPFIDQDDNDLTGTILGHFGLTGAILDTIDNDFDLVANNGAGYVFEIANTDIAIFTAANAGNPRFRRWDPTTWWLPNLADPAQSAAEDRLRAHIAKSYYFINYTEADTIDGVPVTRFFSFTGEPVCDIIGRMAVKITDEASKINMNVAGTLTINDGWFIDGRGEGPMTRVLARGRSPREYETRFLPGIGPVLANRMASLTTGAPRGVAASTVDATIPTGNFYDPPGDLAYAFDASFAGLGRVDDNGDAIWLAMDGIDNDGDGMIDEGLNPLYPEYLGAFEGIDDPDEFQLHRPLRNLIAENDRIDNDRDDVVDEIGEMGDTYLRTYEQIKLTEGIGAARFNAIRNQITVHASDKNGRARFAEPRQARANDFSAAVTDDGIVAFIDALERPRWQDAGIKPHYNYAPAWKIAQQLVEDWGYRPTFSTGLDMTVTPPLWGPDPTDAHAYLRGARVHGITTYNLHGPNDFAGTHSGQILGYPTWRDANDSSATEEPIPWFADLELHAGQLAANIVDSRDLDHARSETTIRINDLWWTELWGGGPAIEPRDITYTVAGIESIRINELMVRPTRRVEAEFISPGSAFAGSPNVAPNFTDVPIATFDRPEFVMTHRTLVSDPLTAPGFQGPLTDPAIGAGWDYPYDGIGIGVNPIFPLGNRSAFYALSYNYDLDRLPGTPGDNYTNMLEFVFEPSPGLPPGNYYLTLNTLDFGGEYALPNDIRFLIKTVSPGENGIIDDLLDGTLPPLIPDGQAYSPLAYSDATSPISNQGNLYLYRDPTQPVLTTDYEVDALLAQDYTVRIPNYNPVSQDRLHIAVWRSELGNPFAVNYFEFSQEPDHEWIEIVNVQDYDLDPDLTEADLAIYLESKAIDLSGWQLRIGAGGGSVGLYEVPQGVRIAPGGSLLLGFNKYDDDPINPIFANNIALMNVDPLNFDTTVPPFPPLNPDDPATSISPSVFVGTRDFVDRDGDGFEDEFAPDNLMVTNVADSGLDPQAFGDRIVELIPIDTTIPSLAGPQDLADLVLAGGILPNYPERDGIDNDGDNDILTMDRVDNNRNALLLSDTTGDGFPDSNVPIAVGDLGIDEPNEGIDEGRVAPPIPIPGNYDPSTGIYTGLFATYNVGFAPFSPEFYNPWPGAYSAYGTNYTLAYNDTTWTSAYDDPVVSNLPPFMGTVNVEPNATRYEMKAFLERKFFPGDNVVITLYEGAAQGSRIADRVTYNERDVINRSIDDLVPCTHFIDLLPYGRDGNDDPVALDLIEYTDAFAASSLWPDDTMGVDFYRSLERKHPLYHGDLHGTTNRWEATDGNYDDWAPSMNVMLPIDGPGVFRSRVSELPILYGHAYQGSPLRMNYWQRAREYPVFDPFNETRITVFGVTGQAPATVATMDLVERTDPYVYGMTGLAVDQWKYWETLADGTVYHKFKVGVRNGPYDSLGDLMRLPNFTMVRYLDSYDQSGNSHPLATERMTGITLFDAPAMAPPGFVNPLAFEGVRLRPIDTLDQFANYRSFENNVNPTRGLDALAVLSGVVDQPIVLSAGQAEFQHGHTIDHANDLTWGNVDNRLPTGWWPVHLFGGESTAVGGPLGINGLDAFANAHGQNQSQANNTVTPLTPAQTTDYMRDHGIFDIEAMLTGVPSFAAGVTISDPATGNDLHHRWGPLMTRTMYVSGNDSGFAISDPTNPTPPLVAASNAQGLFVWRGISGLVDGKYDIYVDTGLDLGPMQRLANDAATTAMFTPFGRWLLLDRAPVTARQSVRLGLKFFTDTQGFRRNQPIDFDRPGDYGGQSPEHGGVTPANYDVFTPDDSGLIYYGEVDIRNSYLAMRLANYSNPGEVARFARVILTPAKRTEGRININTALTQPVQGLDPAEPVYNTLVGIPGVFMQLDPDIRTTPNPAQPIMAVADVNPALPGKQLLTASDDPGVIGSSEFGDGSVSLLKDAYFRAERILGQRPEYADGRYYKWVPHLLGYEPPLFPGTFPQSPLSRWDDLQINTMPFEQELKFKELSERYPRLANMVTTRSDIFEITVTVQSGFVIDENGDGLLNYRDDNEFTSMAQKRTRTIYERR